MRFIFTLALFLASITAQAADFLIEMRRPLTHSEIYELNKKWDAHVELFTNYNNSYFKRLYLVKTKLEAAVLRGSSLVSNVETIDKFSLNSVEPSKVKSKLSNDPLLQYQWAVENTAQTISQDINDITLLRKIGLPQADIDLVDYSQIDKFMSRNALVAVIDSGVDVDHPDLKNNIYVNEVECNKGEIPLRPTEDKDGNGYIGDCKGWNFTGSEKNGTNRVLDDMGHGTHVAGIIAAQINNNIGVSGVSNRIKILPIKVLSQSFENKNGIGLTDRLTKAILYATEMKVDVINLSLGWPLSLDKKYLHEAIQAALDHNIVIVAAAGNNNHSAEIMPCAMHGVICVGSIDNDYTVSQFSNYGLHIDVLAPGDNILSTYPMSKDPVLFSVQGYDLKSGTSQAAPFVSALAAVLKAHYSNESYTQITNRIRLSTHEIHDSQKSFLAGVISFKNALTNNLESKLIPDFKEAGRAAFKMSNPQFTFKLNVENPFNEVKSAPITILANSKQIQILNYPRNITIGAHSSREVPIYMALTDTHADSEIEFSVKIDKSTYLHKIILSRNLDNDKDIEKIEIPNLTQPNLLSLAFRHLNPATPAYYIYDPTMTPTQIEVLWPKGGTLQSLGKIQLQNVKRLLSFSALDLNNDGELEYQAIALIKIGDESTLEYFNFDHKLKPYAPLPHLKLKVEGVIQLDTELSYLYQTVNGQRYAVPFFKASGPLPEKDQPADHFKPRDTSNAERFYYLEPLIDEKNNDATLITRVLDAPDRIKKWIKNKKLRAFSDLKILHILPQTAEDLNLNQLRLLVSYGYDYQRQTDVVVVSFDQNNEPQYKWQNLNTSGLVVDGYSMNTAINLNDVTLPETTLVGALQDNLWQKLSILNPSQSESVQITSDDKSEVINSYIKGYVKNNTRYSFLQTVSEILFTIENENKIRNFRHTFHISTFLPGNLYSEQNQSVWYTDNTRLPALYVDASQIVSRNAYLLVGQASGLSIPVNMNINIPENCLTMNPSLWNNEIYKFTIICKENQSWQMKLLPMNNQ